MAGRQVRLVWGFDYLSLSDSTYKLQADGGWTSQGTGLAVRVLVECSSMAEMERRITAVRQVISRATAHQERMVGDAIEVWTKTCDDLDMPAEFGATWLSKRIKAGRVEVQHLGGVAAAPNAILTIALEVEEAWQRVYPQPLLECTAGVANLDSLARGGLATYNEVDLYARRMRWTSTSGLTARFFWTFGTAAANQINFVRLSANMRCYYDHATKRFLIRDNAGAEGGSAELTLVNGRTYEVVVRWTASTMSVFLDGTRIAHNSESAPAWPTNPDTYRLLAVDGTSGNQQFHSIQVWPTGLTDAQIAALVAWGQPAPELAWYEAPADAAARNAVFPIYNVPGERPAPLRLAINAPSVAAGRVLLAMRPLRRPGTLRMECEAGTLGADTASNSNAAASAGSQARWTPADTSWATRVTVTAVATPSLLAAMQGEYRLYLAGVDSAASVQVNQIQWRLVVAGVAGAWSETRAFAAVGTRSLLDMGTLTLPPGNWPPETIEATTTVYGGAFVTIQLQTRNTTGSGGGVLDLDALFLAPAEAEGEAQSGLDAGTPLVLDWTCEPPASVLVSSLTSYEFANWASYTGDDLTLQPSAGVSAGVLTARWLVTGEEHYPNAECNVYPYMASRWLV